MEEYVFLPTLEPKHSGDRAFPRDIPNPQYLAFARGSRAPHHGEAEAPQPHSVW